MRRNLATLLLLLIGLLLLSQPIFADTEVSGVITNDTIWVLSGSPYIVTGNVLVSEGVTLTIEPDVEVKFESKKVLQVEGTLIARGTSDNVITFTSNQSSPAPGDWGYIYFKDTSTDATFDANGNYTGGSILEYCVIEYAGGLSVDDNGSVRMNDAHPFINYCTVQSNSSSGINAWDLSGTFKLTNSTISNNTGEGIFTLCISYYHTDYSPTVIANNNTISNNSGRGIHASGKIMTMCKNIISNNIGGIFASGKYGAFGKGDEVVTISNNTISNNTANRRITNAIRTQVSDTLVISGNTISNNSATYGGALIDASDLSYTGQHGTITISDNIISNNTSYDYIFLIYARTTTSISNNFIINNNASDGIVDAATVSDNIIINNTSSGRIVSGGTVSNNIIINNTSSGRIVGAATVSNNIISNNTSSGNHGTAVRGRDTFSNSIIRNSAPNASAVYYDADNFIYNTITGNISTGTEPTYTIYISQHPLFYYNNIFDNASTYQLYNDNSVDSSDVNAENNWWGTMDESQIQAKIYDWYDDGSKGFVDYSPFLTAIDTTAPISPPLGLTVIGVDAESISIQWDANTEGDTEGYMVYWDTDGEFPYENVVDVGNVTSYTITGLTPDIYYVTVTAYDNDYDAGNDNPDTIVNENQTGGHESWYALVQSLVLSSAISVTPTNYDFGNVTVGDTAMQTFTVSNTGDLDLVIDALSVTGTDTSEFAIQHDNCSGQNITSSGTCTVDVMFAPISAGAKNATLNIPSNDPDISILEVNLDGTGIDAAPPSNGDGGGGCFISIIHGN